jgi:hypothetical protein
MSKGKGGWVTVGTLVGVGGAAAAIAFFVNKIKTAAYEVAPSVFQRDPQTILDAVAVVDPGHNPDLQPGANGGADWCNKALYLMLDDLGVPMPADTLANNQISYMASGADGWYAVSSPDDAQALALQGQVVVAAYYNPGGHGHVALVLPIATSPMQIAQAGAATFNQGSLQNGFGLLIKPLFFAHA